MSQVKYVLKVAHGKIFIFDSHYGMNFILFVISMHVDTNSLRKNRSYFFIVVASMQ